MNDKNYTPFKEDAATYRRRIDELERAIRNLKNVEGRHHTEIACRRLYDLLPENAKCAATGSERNDHE
jgi:hypothetical protein